jgi:aminopeptidase N
MLRYQLAHDPDVLGRVEAAEALGEQGDEESVKALAQSLLNDAFWGVRVAAAEALAQVSNVQAQEALLQALSELDAREFSRVRAAVASALGRYAQPTRPELAQRSATALASVFEAKRAHRARSSNW